MNPLQNAGLFLIHTLFDMYAIVLMLRLILQTLGANYYNPICQIIIKLTDPVVRPLQSVIPKTKWLDLSAFTVLLLLELIKLFLLVWISAGTVANPLWTFLWAVIDIADLYIDILFFAVLIRAILSWVAPFSQQPIVAIIYLITEPVLRPARRLIPPIAGLDLSPIFILILLQLTDIVIITPLHQLFSNLAL